MGHAPRRVPRRPAIAQQRNRREPRLWRWLGCAPATLDTPGKRALYNNLRSAGAGQVGESPAAYNQDDDKELKLALEIDQVVRQVRPDGWRGIQSREQVIKAALYGVLKNVDEVERIFLIIKAQSEY